MSERRPIEIQLAAEASLIGSVLHKRELLRDLGSITAEHFIDPLHAGAWKRIFDDASIQDIMALQLEGPELTAEHSRRISQSVHSHQTVLRARDYLIESRRKRDLRKIASDALAALDAGTEPSENIALQLSRATTSLQYSNTKSLPAHQVAKDLCTKVQLPANPDRNYEPRLCAPWRSPSRNHDRRLRSLQAWQDTHAGDPCA